MFYVLKDAVQASNSNKEMLTHVFTCVKVSKTKIKGNMLADKKKINFFFLFFS